jgi:hypothetical protein
MEPPKDHECFHSSPPLSRLSQIKPCHAHPVSVRFVLSLFSHLPPCLPSFLCYSGFLTKTLYVLCFFTIPATCAANLIPLFAHPNIRPGMQIMRLPSTPFSWKVLKEVCCLTGCDAEVWSNLKMEAIDASETGSVLYRLSLLVFSFIPFIRSSSFLLSTLPLKDEGQHELNIKIQPVPRSKHTPSRL